MRALLAKGIIALPKEPMLRSGPSMTRRVNLTLPFGSRLSDGNAIDRLTEGSR